MPMRSPCMKPKKVRPAPKAAKAARRYLRQNLLQARNKVDMAIAKALTAAHKKR